MPRTGVSNMNITHLPHPHISILLGMWVNGLLLWLCEIIQLVFEASKKGDTSTIISHWSHEEEYLSNSSCPQVVWTRMCSPWHASRRDPSSAKEWDQINEYVFFYAIYMQDFQLSWALSTVQPTNTLHQPDQGCFYYLLAWQPYFLRLQNYAFCNYSVTSSTCEISAGRKMS